MIENFSDIGKRIGEQMNRLDLKQVDLCRITGLSKNAISNYINGNRVPDTLAVYKLSQALKTSIEWILIGGEDSDFSSVDSTKELILSEEEKEIIYKVRSGLQPIFDNDVKRLTGEVGRLNDMEHDIILKFRELGPREQEDIYDNVNWKYEKNLKKKISSSSTTGGKDEGAATSETA